MDEKITQILQSNKFHVEFQDSCFYAEKTYNTELFGEIGIDLFDGEGIDGSIRIVKDYEDILKHELSEENLNMCISELNKLKIKE